MTRIALCNPAYVDQAQATKLEKRGMIVLWTQGLPAGEPVRVLKPLVEDDERERPAQDAVDAKRYRFLRQFLGTDVDGEDGGSDYEWVNVPNDQGLIAMTCRQGTGSTVDALLDSAIDAGRAAGGESK